MALPGSLQPPSSLALIGIGFVLGGHLCLTKSDIAAALRAVREWKREQMLSFKSSEQWLQQRLRQKEDLLEKCADTISNMQKNILHLSALFVCASAWMMGQETNIRSVGLFLAAMLVYSTYAILSKMRMTIDRMHWFSIVTPTILTLLVVSSLNEADLEHILCSEKFCAIGLILSAANFADLKLLLPVYLFSAVAFSYKHWKIIGFENVTPIMVHAALAWHGSLVITTIFVVRTLETCATAKRESHDSSSLMLGFQRVLRGVCDGDVVLQRSSCTIVEDAACLERLLKSNKKLCNTNFLDLFLDLESRNAFLNFLNAGDADNALLAMIPRGLRVSLQGANGPVSMDLFHARIPRDSVAGGDYSLLAMKEDADQSSRSTPPDAPPESQTPAVPVSTHAGPATRTISSISDVVDAYDELVEFSLLVNNTTDMLDIQEAHLSFRRQCLLPTLESGMPTLRKFIRPTDWYRIETMIQNIAELSAEDRHSRCYFRHPMLFRIPGESRSYLRSLQVFMSLADRAIVPGTLTRFWFNCSSFDDSRIRRPREQDLEGIQEEEQAE